MQIGITKQDFYEYEKCRQGGKTNMFHITMVESLTGLAKHKIKDIMTNYARYKQMYGGTK